MIDHDAFFLYLKLAAERSDFVQIDAEVDPAVLARPPPVSRDGIAADKNRKEPETSSVS
ncbi:hypothetical protein QKW52_24320 [Bacillus sonorensis]|nr:hypothetical protein [Bacillus sonorensis]